MGGFFDHPAVQGGVAPFVIALAVAFALFSVRLAGLAVVAALGTAVYLIGGFALPPVSAQQKILLISLAVPVSDEQEADVRRQRLGDELRLFIGFEAYKD